MLLATEDLYVFLVYVKSVGLRSQLMLKRCCFILLTFFRLFLESNMSPITELVIVGVFTPPTITLIAFAILLSTSLTPFALKSSNPGKNIIRRSFKLSFH